MAADSEANRRTLGRKTVLWQQLDIYMPASKSRLFERTILLCLNVYSSLSRQTYSSYCAAESAVLEKRTRTDNYERLRTRAHMKRKKNRKKSSPKFERNKRVSVLFIIVC
jgi:hypothetical protein